MTTRVAMTTFLASLLILMGGMRHAGAQPPPEVRIPPLAEPSTTEPTTRTTGEHYGWQILLVDAASVAASFVVGNSDAEDGLLVFAGGYLLGGPIVHLSHGKPGRAMGSFALRAGLPALGAGLALLPAKTCEDCGPGAGGIIVLGAAVGVIGMGVATVVDWTALSAPEKAPVESGPTLVPQVSVGADGNLRIGVVGRF